jgi:two-component system, chemotaxis family, response regulator Rcp1
MDLTPTLPLRELLLVDDNAMDIRLTHAILKKSKVPARVNTAADGVEALEFLRRQGRFCDAPTPDLVLLDVNMPRMNGLEVLSQIKEDPALRHIPIIILTSSESEQDIHRAYDSHANCFISKPSDMAEFTKVVNMIAEFWFRMAKLPLRGVKVR